MWGSLAAAVGLLLLFVYGPGYLLLRGFGQRRSISLACAPIVTIVIYSILAIVYAKVGIFCSWVVLVVPTTAVAVVCFVAGKLVRAKSASHRGDRPSDGRLQRSSGIVRMFFIYLAVGVCGTIVLFVLPLGSADSFICGFDIGHHLAAARSFVESGNWSTLEVSLIPGGPGMFYPSVNSLLPAMVIGCLGVPVTLSLNAVNVFVVGFVFPLGMWLFMGRVFGWRDPRCAMGAVCTMLFVAFPWETLSRSAPLLYAYVIGLCLLPIFMAVFMDALKADPLHETRNGDAAMRRKPRRIAVGSILLCIVSLAAIALSHPCAFFSAMLFVVGYVAHVLLARTRSWPIARRAVHVGLWFVACAVAWAILFFAPFLHDVVYYQYREIVGAEGGLIDVLFLRSVHIGVQYVLGGVTILGIIACAKDRQRRWLLLAYALTVCLCLACFVIPLSTPRYVLTGFWYNHTTRLMATLAIFAMPIAAQGFGWIMDLVTHAVCGDRGRVGRGSARVDACPRGAFSRLDSPSVGWPGIFAAAVLVAAIAFLPLPLYRATTLSDLFILMTCYNDPAFKTSFLDQPERDFLVRAAEVTGDDIVLNAPHDGSAFAYALDGMNTMARSFHVYDDPDAYLLAQKIDRIALDPAVANAADALGVEYVVQLDAPGYEENTVYQADYVDEDWKGIFAINESTPGFELVLSEGDMRLYRILR